MSLPPLPPDYPTADASFENIDFWELEQDGRYSPYAPEDEHTTIGRTLVYRYVKPVEMQVPGLCGLSEADDFEDAVGHDATLVFHHGTVTAHLVRAEVKRIIHLAVAEIVLHVVI